jgi:NAD(P)-dependent dehydrogenase (short-subunit alcohol dehydrogenase family)
VAGMMEGKVAVVTGAGCGVGREVAIMMADAGAKGIVADIGASLSGDGGSAPLAQQTDAVVNNAGIPRDGIFHKMSEDDWLSVFSVHLNGSFFVSRAATERYRQQESGAFVHITSTSGLIGNVGKANYAAAKLGITALSRSIALDMQPYNVRSNCVLPWARSRLTSSIPTLTTPLINTQRHYTTPRVRENNGCFRAVG